MLREFAVDPATLSTWQSYRYTIEKFGVEHGRLIATFPKYWQTLVYKACSECKDVERKRIVESLTKIDCKLLNRGRPYGTAPTWLLNAEAEHLRESFHAIIAATNPRNRAYVKLWEDLSENDDCFKVERERAVPRTVQDLAACVDMLFQGSKEILFVDPHFDPDRSRYRSTLKEFVRIATIKGSRPQRIEFHLGNKCEQKRFRNNCEQFLVSILPRGVTVTFFRWEQIDQGDHLHARYILTDIGGLHFDSGLDAGELGETTDVRLLTKALYDQRWNDYQTSDSTTKGLTKDEKAKFQTTFRLVDRIEVIGRRAVRRL
jgi:hypothetical protein